MEWKTVFFGNESKIFNESILILKKIKWIHGENINFLVIFWTKFAYGRTSISYNNTSNPCQSLGSAMQSTKIAKEKELESRKSSGFTINKPSQFFIIPMKAWHSHAPWLPFLKLLHPRSYELLEIHSKFHSFFEKGYSGIVCSIAVWV